MSRAEIRPAAAGWVTLRRVSWLRQVATLALKDLRVEYRSREIVYTMAFFAAMVVLMFSFSFLEAGASAELGPAQLSPGFLFIAMLFAGTVGLSRAFDRERTNDTMRGLLMSPVPRSAIFCGKAVAITAFIVGVQLVVVPLVWFFFEPPLFASPLSLVAILLLSAIGFATVGSVFAAMLLRTRSRDVLLPVVLYPLLIPLLIVGVKGVGGIIGNDPGMVAFSIKFILFYDVMFAAAALWTFESLVIE